MYRSKERLKEIDGKFVCCFLKCKRFLLLVRFDDFFQKIVKKWIKKNQFEGLNGKKHASLKSEEKYLTV